MQREEALKQYLITDPLYYSNDLIEFEKTLKNVLENNHIDIACFRDKESANYNELAKVFVRVCKTYKVENILLNENIELAKELQCGIHLTSRQFHKIKEAKENNMYVIISCHDIEQIEKAQKSFVNAVTYSPIFATPNKGEPKGLPSLKKILSIYDMNIIALGGIIEQQHIEQIDKTRAYGFASIRYFLK